MKIAIRSLVLVLAAGVSACSKTETQGTENTNPPVANDATQTPAANTPVVEPTKVEAPVVEQTAPTPAVGNASGGPIGSWRLDGTATYEANRAAIEESVVGASEEDKAMMLGMMTEMFGAMGGTLTLNADNSLNGSMSMSNPMTGEAEVTTMTGSWAKDGESYTLTTREEGKDADDVNTATIDGGTLKLVVDEGGRPMTIVFLRQS